VGLGLTGLSLVAAQQVQRDGFENLAVRWVKGNADAPFRETAHALTDQTAHIGQHSEHIQLTAESGTFIHYFYTIKRAPVTDELTASVWVRANRPGLQLMGRLVLPRERDPRSPDTQPTTLLRGDLYQQAGRWQRLELRSPVKLAREQQQFMRAEFKRDVDFTDAYLDRLVLNVYGGPGLTEVWIDDLEVGPVVEATPFQTTSRPVDRTGPGALATPRRPGSRVEFKGDRLEVDGKPFFIRGIRHSDTPLSALRDAGFNTVWFDYRTAPAVLDEASRLGMKVVMSLPVTADDRRLTANDGLAAEINRLLGGDGVLFWDLGGGLVEEQKEQVRRAVQVVRAADAQHPLGIDAWDGLEPYSRTVDLMGSHRWPLMTALELPQYREWLDQRRLLARFGTFTWTWVQTHLPDWYTTLVYDRPGTAGFDEPIGPQPEQVRLLTYLALASGCRGLGFWSDRFLANSHQGRDRLLGLALLNLELQMLEPALVSARSPRWIDTSIPDVKAAVLRTDQGVLVLPMWLGKGAQFVPGQSAAAKLTMVVPEVPPNTQPWLISPVKVHALEYQRVLGGTSVTVPQFGLTAAVLFTAENGATGAIVRLEDQARRMREKAAYFAHDLAAVELDKAAGVETQLEQAGHTLPDGKPLMEEARKRLRACVESYNNRAYGTSYDQAHQSLQAVRILMRAQWEQATKGLDSPVASPYAVSFFTLPRHYQLMEQVKQAAVGPNVLRGGDFELSPDQVAETWTVQEACLDAVEMRALRVAELPKEGKQCLMLEVKPRTPALAPRALERTFLAINSPAVRLQPGTRVKVSGWVRIPQPITGSVDGALFYDSAGGEPLAVRLTGTTGWKQFTLYRWVPASGLMNVTLALTGLGTVYFDDIRIEPLQESRPVPGAAGGGNPR
jgi:hypothetical protein